MPALAIPSADPTKSIGMTLVHGLLTGDNGWAGQLMAWGNTNTAADWSSLSYFEGVFGWGHQQHLDALVKLLRAELLKSPEGKQHAVGHSNGCRLLLEALIANPDIVLDDLHLIAAWTKKDCIANGINTLIARGQVKRIFLYVSSGDDVLGMNNLTPWYWGWTLGKDGPVNPQPLPLVYQVADMPANTTWPFTVGLDPTQTHCSWVDGPNGFNQETFTRVLYLSGLTKQPTPPTIPSL